MICRPYLRASNTPNTLDYVEKQKLINESSRDLNANDVEAADDEKSSATDEEEDEVEVEPPLWRKVCSTILLAVLWKVLVGIFRVFILLGSHYLIVLKVSKLKGFRWLNKEGRKLRLHKAELVLLMDLFWSGIPLGAGTGTSLSLSLSLSLSFSPLLSHSSF
mgnify:CR=1 FL=1